MSLKGRAFMTVADEMADFAVRAKVALVRIGSSKDVLSGEMRVAGWDRCVRYQRNGLEAF